LDQGHLEVTALDEDPGQSYPLCINPRHRHYEVETELVLEGDVCAGLILFYSPRAFVSIGLSSDGTLAKGVRKTPGQLRMDRRHVLSIAGRRIRLKFKNDRQDVSAYYALPDDRWHKLERSDDISGFQHNVFGGFISVRPGLYVTGKGKARFSYFQYRGY
jgi:xylan 1,4-beta-xylosidase